MSPGKNTALNRKAPEAAVAVVECPTLHAAAARVNVAQRTIRRWLELPAFQELVNEASRAAYRHAQNRMRSLCAKAAATLNDAMDRDGASSVQVRAALGTLDFVAKADLSELEARIAALESRTPTP